MDIMVTFVMSLNSLFIPVAANCQARECGGEPSENNWCWNWLSMNGYVVLMSLNGLIADEETGERALHP